MESFVHLRKGTTPRRVHADLDGLKDDELGRGGFTGRTANIYRRTRSDRFSRRRAVSPRRRPRQRAQTRATPPMPAGAPLLLFSNADCRISLSRRGAAMPFHVRYVDGDLLCFVHQGAGTLETEFGPLNYRTGDWIYLPKACTWRQIAVGRASARASQHLADDRGHRRVPDAAARPAGAALAVRPGPGRDPRARAHRRRRPRRYEVRLSTADRRRGARRRCSIGTTRSTSRAGAATTSRSPSISTTTTSSPPTACTCRRWCTCSWRPPGSTSATSCPSPPRRCRAPNAPLVPPQRRLRRDRVLPRRLALRHPDAAGPDQPRAAGRAPRRAGEGARTRTAQVRRVRHRRLEGHRHRHPAAAGPVGRRCWPRDLGAALDDSTHHRLRPHPVSGCLPERFGCPRRLRRPGRDRRAGVLPCSSPRQPSRHRAGVHAPDRRRRLPADGQRPGPRRPPRHLREQPVPRHRLRAADGEGGPGPRRGHQGRQEPAGLLQGGAGRLERRRFAVAVLPAAGPEPDDHRQSVRRRTGPDDARADPGRRRSCCWPPTSAGTAP